MLAAKATALRASQLARRFATAIDTSGVKVAAVDNGQSTSAVTFLIKAGSRFETQPGVAHVLKNFAFKSTAKRSALGTVREAELYGGVLSSSLTREHLAFTAEFLRGDEQFFVELLSSLITIPKYTRWELNETVLPVVESESLSSSSNPATRALELAHAAAFRSGLGFSVLAPPHPAVSVDDVRAFASSAFCKGNIAVLGTGIEQSLLAKLVESNLTSASLKDAAAPKSAPTKYFGGDTRYAAQGGLQTVFVGFGSTGAPLAELAVLSTHLSPLPSLKWSQGTSPLSSVLPVGTSVQTVLLPYSDATLFGLLVQGASAEGVKEASTLAVKALKETSATGVVKPEDLKKAVAKAKFAAASAVEDRDGFVTTFGPQLLSGSQTTLDSTFSALDKVDAAALSKVSSSLLKTTPTYVAVGDISALPYKEEVGL